MGILAQWNLKVLGLNSADGLGCAGPSSGTQSHYEAPGNFHIREVIVTCSKFALGQLIQIQVMDIISCLNNFFYLFIRNLGLILKFVQKNQTSHTPF